MIANAFPRGLSGRPRAVDQSATRRLFGDHDDLLPLWIAEPYVPLAPSVVDALQGRASEGWYGYEVRPSNVTKAFWAWMGRRLGWDGSGLHTMPSPSIGTSIGALIDLHTETGDGVILQPPVFTDFKPLITALGREPVRNPLVFEGGAYSMDLDHLETVAAGAATKVMILCNPHNPVGRVWSVDELRAVSEICAENDVLLISDEIHADLTFGEAPFAPIATVAPEAGGRWAATHGPIKTFGLAGVADTLLVSDDDELAEAFRGFAGRFHINRNNVFSIAATLAGYTSGDEWLDGLLARVQDNLSILRSELPDPVRLVESEATYLAWIDFRDLGMDVPELTEWLSAKAGLALSPGHWFGRQGAGFARMTIAVDSAMIEESVSRISRAV